MISSNEITLWLNFCSDPKHLKHFLFMNSFLLKLSKISLIATAFGFLFPCLTAQEVQVLNSTTNEPIENVAIYNQHKNKSILTNDKGIAPISDFSASDSLFFQHPSFLRYVISYEEAVKARCIKLDRKVIIMPEFVISASKYKETQRDIAHMVDVITPQKLELLTSQTSADILTSTGNIFVQKSQGGGGSPVLRGFEANKILLVVDGIRMNNAIYRSGHLQNSITIDESILEKVEIVYGPNAIMYGSDALGGVIHYITKDPELATDTAKMEVHASAYTQISSANSAWKAHIDFNLASQKLGSLTSITNNDFGDIMMGNRRNPFLQDYGKCFYYVEQVNGNDTIVENPEPNVQKYTGYSQIDILQKFRYRPSSKLNFVVNLQYSTSSDIPRYDMLNDTSDNGNLKYSVWNYGPQKRFLGSIKSVITSDYLLFNSLTATIGYQNIVESRISRKYQSSQENTQNEKVQVWTGNFDFMKSLTSNSKLIYGSEININEVNSTASNTNIATGEKTDAVTRYPDDGNYTSSYSVYAAYKSKIGKRFIASLGTRYSYSSLKSNYSDSVEFVIPYKSLDIVNSSFTGSLGLIYLHSLSSKINLLLSTGYRIPNLDDLAKIRVKGNQITYPNPKVEPEYSYNAELGFSKTFDGYIQINGSYFISFLTNVIVRVPYYQNGADSIMSPDGEWLKAFVNDNSNRGIIHGFNLNLISDLNSNISFKGTLNYTYGRDLTLNEPLAHIPPIYGKADFIYETKRFTHEFFIIYSGWKRIEDMTLTGEDNVEEGTPYGFPGWYTLNLRSTYYASKNISIQFALENIINNFYKPFATAIAAPGINFIATLRVKV